MDEDEHVHKVYEEIAQHFSNTRYKPWPVVEAFLKAQSLAGSFGADIGCGNGKYIGVADPAICPDPFYFGCDRSRSLVSIAHGLHPHANLACADILSLPYRSASFDFVLSIAVIHHLNSEDRRLQALSEMTRIARPGARILVFVWALEQKGKRQYEQQDVLVPWHLRSSSASSSSGSEMKEEKVLQRYYHMFKEGELESLISRIPFSTRIVSSGYDRDNWFVEFTKE